MSELVMMEAALFQLRAALGDDPELLAMRLSADVLANAVAAAKDNGINAARVNDIEFALNDLVSAVDDAGAPDAVCSAIALLQNDTARCGARTRFLPKRSRPFAICSCACARAARPWSAASIVWKAPRPSRCPIRARSSVSWPFRSRVNSRPRGS